MHYHIKTGDVHSDQTRPSRRVAWLLLPPTSIQSLAPHVAHVPFSQMYRAESVAQSITPSQCLLAEPQPHPMACNLVRHVERRGGCSQPFTTDAVPGTRSRYYQALGA